MASSSGSWLTVFILIVIGAILIVTLNEANFGYLNGDKANFGRDIKSEGGKLLDDFVEKLSGKPQQPAKIRKPANNKDKNLKVNPNQKDDLGFKDRAELNELLENVGD